MNPQDLLLKMVTEIFKIDASWAKKLKKTRVSKILSPTVCRCRVDLSIYTLNNNEQSQNINWITDEVCQSAVVIVCLLRSIGTGSEHSENTSQRLHIFSFSFMFIRIDFHNPWKNDI